MGTSAPASELFSEDNDKSRWDHRSMSHARLVSMFSRGWMTGRAVLLSVAVLGLLAVPSRSPAQDAGVSGIPPGPGNARGLNGSISDPSGIGNAARIPAPPPPSIAVPVVPSVAPPISSRVSSRSTPNVRRAYRQSPPASRREVRRSSGRALRTQDKLLDSKLSICRGC